jgi:hypothetical protein
MVLLFIGRVLKAIFIVPSLCSAIVPSLALAQPPPSSSTTAYSNESSVQMHAPLLESIKRIISFGDLRGVRQFEEVLGTPTVLEPQMVNDDRHQIVGWITVRAVDKGASVALPPFEYLIAIQDGVRWASNPTVIAEITFNLQLSSECITEDGLTAEFGPPDMQLKGIDGGLRQPVRKVAVGRGFSIKLNATFLSGTPCAVSMTLIQLKDDLSSR